MAYLKDEPAADRIEEAWLSQGAATAARIKVGGGLSYADAFCIATAQHLNASLWTGDPEIIELASRLRCEVVDLRPGWPAKPTP